MSRSTKQPTPWRTRLGQFEWKASPYLYIAPFFLLFAVVGLFLLLFTVYIATRQYNTLTGDGGVAICGATCNSDEPSIWPTSTGYCTSNPSGTRCAIPSPSSSSARFRKSFWRCSWHGSSTRISKRKPSGAWECCCHTSWHRARPASSSRRSSPTRWGPSTCY